MLGFLLMLATQIPPMAGDRPNRQPQMAARGKDVALTFGAGNTIYFAASHDSGRTFGPPSVVAAVSELSLGMRRGPRIAFARDGIVISAVVGELGNGRDGDLLAWRSTDGGKTWSPPVRVNDIGGSAREGLHAMASDGKDVLFAAWLDLRAKGTRIYGATSKDGGATWSENRLVYESPSGTVCQCCHPSVAVDPHGTILVMFRNALDGSRDLYLVRSEDAGRTFGTAGKVGVGTWKLEACPMDGGGTALDDQGRVSTIWRREATVFATDGGAEERPLAPGKNPVVAASMKGIYRAWTNEGHVMLLRPGRDRPEAVGEGGFPTLISLDGGSIEAAWESEGAIVIQPME